MALFFSFTAAVIVIAIATAFLLLPVSYAVGSNSTSRSRRGVVDTDVDLIEFPLNLEYFEAEFFLWGSLGLGLDTIAPNLTMGGPPPIGAKLALLDPFTRDIITQFAFQEVGHLRF